MWKIVSKYLKPSELVEGKIYHYDCYYHSIGTILEDVSLRFLKYDAIVDHNDCKRCTNFDWSEPMYYEIEEIMNVEDAYLLMQENCGIKVGDEVKVLRAAKSRENGWGDDWVKKMDYQVGSNFVVSSLHERSGVKLSSGYWVPFFVLEKIIPPPIMIGSYQVVFEKDYITVGYQKVTKDQIKQIYDRMFNDTTK